ncbi:MAG: phosphoribosylanthranilate isomerase [Planctomycetota bacterium]
MFHVKICGVRNRTDIEAVASSGGDAIGLNFFPKSVRYLDPSHSETRQLSQAAASLGLLRIAVVVDESSKAIQSIASAVGVDAIQLHGDEGIEQLGAIRREVDLPVIRAIKLSHGSLEPDEIQSRLEPWVDAACHVLLDADAGKQHGGSGKALDWPSIQRWQKAYPNVPWTLAGGLTPENVAEAIKVSGAMSVDTASGVEQPKGQKSPSRIAKFCSATGLV